MVEITIRAVGGYEEIGRNMTAIKLGKEVFILDMGIHVEKITSYGEREDIKNLPVEKLYEIEALPDDRILSDWSDKIKSIIISHGHLDHVAAVPYIASNYPVPIYATPYTMEVLKFLVKDGGVTIPNPLKVIPPGQRVELTDNVELEFIYMTHSIPQTVMPVLKYKNVAIVYAADFKFDNYPIIGKKPDYKRLKEIRNEFDHVILIVETTRVEEESKTYSEVIAKYMIEDVFESVKDEEGIVITTFSSHIARLKSIAELATRIDRKPVFLGRSMYKYIRAAEKIGLINFREFKVAGDPKKIIKTLRKIEKEGKDKYLLVVTGHQGEPNSMLDKMATERLPWTFTEKDVVIFSSIVIPHPINIANRQLIESRIKRYGTHIIKDVHVSGHARKEDHRHLLKLLRPDYIFPMHGDMVKRAAYVELASENGYGFNENIFLLSNGHEKTLNL